MLRPSVVPERRTSADIVFEGLYNRIMSLSLLPGTKMSEVEIAEQYGVSRQPVRDAFNRLGNLDLLLIQPQRATLVQKFSSTNIGFARFVRLALELEIGRTAAIRWTEDYAPKFEALLADQENALASGDHSQFHTMDEAFHDLIATVAQTRSEFELVWMKKAQIDRICVLSLKEKHEMRLLVSDHQCIYRTLRSGDPVELEKAIRVHLARIEKTIEKVKVSHPNYFQD